MRSSSLLYDIASRKLYRHIRLSQANLQQFLSGMHLIKAGEFWFDRSAFAYSRVIKMSERRSPRAGEQRADDREWEGKLKLFGCIKEITGIVLAGSGNGRVLQHNDVAAWALGLCPKDHILDRDSVLLPNLRIIHFHTDLVHRQPGLTVHVRPVDQSAAFFQHPSWDICMRIGSHARVGRRDASFARPYGWLQYLSLRSQVRNLAVHSHDSETAKSTFVQVRGSYRIYIMTPDTPGNRSDIWREIVKHILDRTTRVRVFGAFDSSTAMGRTAKVSALQELVSLGQSHRRERVDVPKRDSEKAVWFAPDGYREYVWCRYSRGI